MSIPDAEQRKRALDPHRSYVVQAPAGSGKTELLIQRYLTLLARVDQPECVVAITFTRKAAGEMRLRVIRALQDSSGPCPSKQHEALTWELACAVRERSEAFGWDLFRNPGRLRGTVLRLCPLHRLRAKRLWRNDRRLLGSATAATHPPTPQAKTCMR